MTLDARLVAPLEAAGEAVIGSLMTAGEHAFSSDDGQVEVAPVWMLLGDRRTWLVAVAGDRVWVVAEGAPGAVEVRKGWVTDEIRVGPWTAPLRRGTRAAAVGLVARAPQTGEPAIGPAEDGARTEERATAARGATALPDWWADHVPGASSERWLGAAPTSSTHPFNTPSCIPVDRPLWVGISDARVVVAAHEPGQERTRVWEVGAPLVREQRPHRFKVMAGARELSGSLLTPRPLREAEALSRAAAGPERWATVVALALEAAEAERALRLVEEALALGRHQALWGIVAQILWVLGEPARAATAAAAALEGGSDPPVAAWAETDARLEKTLRRADLDLRSGAWALLPWLRALPDLEPPAGLPWPPASREEVWATALAMRADLDAAERLWAAGATGHRASAGLAALHTAAGADDAAARWRSTALARRATDPAAAVDALERALAIDPTPHDLWRRAAWAWADGEPDVAEVLWHRVIREDPPGRNAGAHLDAAGERALAAVAEAAGERALAAAAWHRAAQLAPDDGSAWHTAAALYEAVGSQADAATVWAGLLAALDQGHVPEPSRPRWKVAAELARLRAGVGDQDGARAALREAIQVDFLRPGAFAAALACPDVELPPRLRAWWAHLGRLVTGASASDDGEALPHVEVFTDEALDALHPGGVGWLEQLRARVEPPELPSRAVLVRGLARLETAHADARAALEQMSSRLGVVPPDSFVFRGEGAWGASAWSTDPAVLLVGVQHLREGPRHLDAEARDFLFAVEVVHLRCGHPVLAFESDLVGTSRSAYAALGRYAGAAENVVDLVVLIPGIDQLAKLQKVIVISRRLFTTRSVIDKATGVAGPVLEWLGLSAEGEAGAVGREGLQGAALQFRLQADRAALLAVGDARAAVEAILRASSSSLVEASRVEEEGLAAVLEGGTLPADEALRITALVEFAAGLEGEGATATTR